MYLGRWFWYYGGSHKSLKVGPVLIWRQVVYGGRFHAWPMHREYGGICGVYVRIVPWILRLQWRHD